MLDAALQQEVAQKGVFFGSVLAEIHKALHIEASAHILQVLMAKIAREREGDRTEREAVSGVTQKS